MAKQDTILIADDSEINRAILQGLFSDEYNLLEAENGEQALMLLRQYQEAIAVVLLDLVMPEKDGYEVMEEMRRVKLLPHVPVIVITADDSADNRVKVFELGASDIIAKPFEPEVVKSRVRNIVELSSYRRSLERQVEEQSARAREANAAVIDMLSSVIEYRSLESGQHIRRIRMFTKILLEDVAESYQEYGLDARKIRLITSASSMHDIGKIAIPDRILNKPGKLTAEEFEVMKTHTVKGCELLSGLDRIQDRDYLQYAYDICRFHHERWDGRGYPDGLKGNSIPLCAQVVSIADCYDALTSDRVYKKAVPPGQAYSMILNGECGQFSPRILECFKHVQEPYARLSAEYADGLPAGLNQTDPVTAPEDSLLDLGGNTLEQSQERYFSLLRYLDATVVELDLDTGMYHLVYLADQNFSLLRSGSSFDASIRNFAEAAVHPDDLVGVLGLLDGCIQELFEEGLTRRERRYRVLDRGTGQYIWCRAAVLRTSLEHPRLHRVLLIWSREQAAAPETQPAVKDNRFVDQLLGGTLKCRCDDTFTILKINRQLVELTGYSEQEIAEQFRNRLIDLIHPADRARVARQYREQRDAGRVLELEYRLQTKDGRAAWAAERTIVMMEGGEEAAYSVLLDVTRSRQAEEELRLSLERHNIIMDQTNDIVFEWDMALDQLYLSPNWAKQFGYTPITRDVRAGIPRASHLHPDDMPLYKDLMAAMLAGVPYKEAELRIAAADGAYRWCRVRATAQHDMDGKPFKVVGVILNIDAQKSAEASLEERVSRDELTGLYNRTGAQARVETFLASCGPEDLSALMILDIDDFKQVNNRYGHMFGDAVLVEMAARIGEFYRDADTVARIGGDEFLIFMPNVRRRDVAEQRAADMIRALQGLLFENGLSFSCSIGLAFSGGVGFQELFDRADRALYRAKSAGKGRYVCYQDEMREDRGGAPCAGSPSPRTEIDSDQVKQWDMQKLIISAFEILYNTDDLIQAVQSILALVGNLFGVSRAYIMESSDDGATCSNTFEWCAEGITPQRKALQRIPYVDGGRDYRDNFGSDGLFYCSSVSQLKGWERQMLEDQGILATVQFAIREKGMFSGFVGFDDCKVHRLWSREQTDGLTFLGKLLSVFLLKHRAQEHLAESLTNLHSLLDHQEVWLYVLDPETYTLRYINRRTRELVPEAELGQACYEAFYHRDRPCECCVLQKAKETGQCTGELYNPILDLWVLADAAMVEWSSRRACLVSCRNITAYKKSLPQADGG